MRSSDRLSILAGGAKHCDSTPTHIVDDPRHRVVVTFSLRGILEPYLLPPGTGTTLSTKGGGDR